MVNSNKSNLIEKSHQNKGTHKSRDAPYKHPGKPKQNQQNVNKNKNRSAPGRQPYKKPAHGKASLWQSKEAQKQERAKKLQERQALKAQKQKELDEERAKAKQEKEEKIRQYKKKRLERTKALSKKTHRGQPLMKDRMQLLLKQIQEMKKHG